MESEQRDRLVSMLKDLGRKHHSYALSQLANMAMADPFAKIKGMINEMVEKLMKEAQEEASHKAFCDEELGKSRKSQAEKTAKLDKTLARIDDATSTIAELGEAVKALEAELAEADAALAEATKLRSE